MPLDTANTDFLNALPNRGINLAEARVLITGARGFIGGHLADQLVGHSNEVHLFSRQSMTIAPHVGKKMLAHRVDLRDAEIVKEAIASIRPDVVFHLAGQIGGKQDPRLVGEMIANNVVATCNLLAAIAETGCYRVIMTGSAEEPHHTDGEAATSPYAAAKACGTIFADLFRRQYHVPICTLRLYVGYGPRQRTEKLIPYVLRQLMNGHPVRLGNPERRCDFVYVRDIVTALLAAASVSVLPQKPLDIGTGRAVTIADVASLAKKLLGGESRLEFDASTGRTFERDLIADTVPAKDQLHWEHQWPIERGLADTADWLSRS